MCKECADEIGQDPALAGKFAALWPHLNERQRRLVLAAEARSLGRSGIAGVAMAAGVSRTTVHEALKELDAAPLELSRARRPGGGRKRRRELDPALVTELEALVDPTTRGDPMSPLRWTCKSTRQLAQALTAAGHPISHSGVADLLRELEYSLQAAVKTREGSAHPDRNAQFEYLNEQAKRFLRQGEPVISVDTKKKELVGLFKNGGREWQPTGQPEQANVHDFPDPELGKVNPYGVYDLARNAGWVSVSTDHDTSAFAVQSIRRWWASMGKPVYPAASQLLVTADSGGSNGYRVRLWKLELQRLADELGIAITVCHLPPGTSKWKKIEHRLFSRITQNWRGKPLISHEVIVNLIAATTTTTGLTVQAALDSTQYPAGVVVSDDQMATLRLEPHTFHGEWNYTIRPKQS